MRILKVNGIGKLSKAPNLVVINFTLIGEDYDYQEAINKLNLKTAALRNDIVEAGFKKEDLKTQNFSVNTKYNYQNGQNIFLGYEARHDMKLEFDFSMETLNRLLDKLSQSKSNATFSIFFEVKEKEEFKNALIKDAIYDAFNKAQLISETAKIKLGKIVNVNYSVENIIYRSQVKYESVSFASAPSSLDITPSDVEASDNIEIEWEIVNSEI